MEGQKDGGGMGWIEGEKEVGKEEKRERRKIGGKTLQRLEEVMNYTG